MDHTASWSGLVLIPMIHTQPLNTLAPSSKVAVSSLRGKGPYVKPDVLVHRYSVCIYVAILFWTIPRLLHSLTSALLHRPHYVEVPFSFVGLVPPDNAFWMFWEIYNLYCICEVLFVILLHFGGRGRCYAFDLFTCLLRFVTDSLGPLSCP